MGHLLSIRRGRQLIGLATMAFVSCLAGCAGPAWWDNVTSRDFKVKEMFSSPDPMTVLRESTDGDARAKALRSLKEPRANGGSDAQQEEVLKMLAQSALADPQPLCRLSAIQSLGRFKDPRAAGALIQAYDSASKLPSEVSGAIQSQVLASLGESRQPAAVQYLVQTAMRPTPADATDRDRQVVRDNRLAAVRALRNFDGSPEVGEAMAKLLETERDVALQDRARETYAKVTGREPPTNGAPPAADSVQRNDDIQLTGARQKR